MPSDLTGRDLDAAIHEGVMGRPTLYVHGQVYDFESSLQVDRYSTDANAARLVLQEVERRGLQRGFVDAIDEILFAIGIECEFGSTAMGYLTASPEAICRAALRAVKGGKG